MRNRLMQMAVLGAANWAGARMMRRGGPTARLAGRGLTSAAWALPLGMYVARRVRGK